ncbi:MAG TPA: hypothetical protein VLA02_12740, partial [Reyranella sp.]|nr:hypothetical protein [Reyranella sp.]
MPVFSGEVSETTTDLSTLWRQLLAIAHPGPAPDVTRAAASPRLSWSARWMLWHRAWHGPVALLIAVLPAGLSFSVDLPLLGRGLFFAAAIVLYVIVRLVLRTAVDATPYIVREQECRQLWASTLAEWEAKAGPRRFDDKRAELEKLKNWW